MAMFSPSRFLFEKRIAGKLQDRFVTIVMRNKILGKWAASKMNLGIKAKTRYVKSIVKHYIFFPNDFMLVSKIKSDFWKAGVDCLSSDIYKKIQKIENRLNMNNVKRSLPKKILDHGDS